MEYKIGQIFETDGSWYQFVEDGENGCKSCVFNRGMIRCTNPEEDVKCAKWLREDGKNGHFVRLLPLGKVYEQGGAKWRQYKCIEKPNTEDKRVYIANADSEVGLIVSIKFSSNDVEYKIGEIFKCNNDWFQCVEGNDCDDCEFDTINCSEIEDIIGGCSSDLRNDDKSVIFKKLEKVGEPFERNGYMYQEYKTHIYPLLMSGGAKIPTDNGFAVVIEQNKEDMKEVNNPNPSNFENFGKNLKPFDLQAAKSGKPVCTRDGRKVRVICFDSKNDPQRPIVALVEHNDNELLYEYTIEGKECFSHISTTGTSDLMMLPEKKEGWVNMYRDEESKRVYCGEFIFSEREKAEKHYECNDTKVATVPINWEE